MTTRPLSFVFLTDLHIGHRSDLPIDSSANFEHAIGQLLPTQPRLIILGGDLVDRGDVESYAALKRQLAALGIPVIYALGNHDARPAFYAAILDRTEDPDEPYFHAETIDGVHILTLDSSTPGSVGGTIEPEQFVWLEAELARHPDLPKLIVSHHPPAIGAAPDPMPWRTIDFEQSKRLGAMLRGRNVLGILSGHIHHDRISMWNRIPVVVTTGLHSAIDVLFTSGVRVVSGASFSIGTVREGGLDMTFVPLPSDRGELRVIRDEDRLTTPQVGEQP